MPGFIPGAPGSPDEGRDDVDDSDPIDDGGSGQGSDDRVLTPGSPDEPTDISSGGRSDEYVSDRDPAPDPSPSPPQEQPDAPDMPSARDIDLSLPGGAGIADAARAARDALVAGGASEGAVSAGRDSRGVFVEVGGEQFYGSGGSLEQRFEAAVTNAADALSNVSVGALGPGGYVPGGPNDPRTETVQDRLDRLQNINNMIRSNVEDARSSVSALEATASALRSAVQTLKTWLRQLTGS